MGLLKYALIKKYTNRKFYDATNSKYVTLGGISDLIKQGVEVKVIDNKSKADITASVFLGIVYQTELDKINSGSEDALRPFTIKRFVKEGLFQIRTNNDCI